MHLWLHVIGHDGVMFVVNWQIYYIRHGNDMEADMCNILAFDAQQGTSEGFGSSSFRPLTLKLTDAITKP